MTEEEAEPAGAGRDAPEQDPVPGRFHLRRAPRFRAFGLTGALAGILVAAILARTPVPGEAYSARSVFGYFALVLGLIGTVLGLGVAVLLDRRR